MNDASLENDWTEVKKTWQILWGVYSQQKKMKSF